MNKKPSIMLVLIILIFALQPEVFSQTTPGFPRLEPDVKALQYYNMNTRNTEYTWEELAEISLWVSGDSNAVNIGRIRSIVAAINNSPELPAAGREKAEFILTFMHANILRSYSLQQTRVDTIFTNGVFNCVSSAVLYTILCESFGIRTSGVITRDHAFITVHIDGQNIDVETTNRYGFDPGNRRDFHDQFGRLTGFTYVPAQNYRDRQTINKIELISIIFNNRIADLERRNNFADSVPLAVDRAALLMGESLADINSTYPSGNLFSDPKKDLMDRLLNYGSTLLRNNREEDGVRWAVLASSQYPDTIRWQDYLQTAVNNRTARFLRENRITDARNFLEANKNYMQETGYIQLDNIIIDADMLSRINRINSDAEGNLVINDIEMFRNNGRMDERRASELITYAVQRTAMALCAAPQRNWRAAINYIEVAITRFGANREWEQALRTYNDNLAADYHNRFAAEWNRRNYDEAELILNEGLAQFPNNRHLLADLEIVNRHRSR